MENNFETEQQPKPENKKAPKNWVTWVLIALLVLLLAGSGYLWMQLQTAKETAEQLSKEKQQLQEQIDELKGSDSASIEEAGGTEPACTYEPSTSFKDNIKAALDTKNTAAFATYTTNPVKYILAASEYGGNVSATEAATSLEYTHSATGPWDFNLSAATIAGYDGGFYTDYFDTNTLVGKAASGMVVAFEFNCDGSKITDIFVAADDDLL